MDERDEYLWEEAEDTDPDWDAGPKVHNWRNYIGEKTRAMWSTFTHEQRYALVYDADRTAADEHWD